MNINIKAILLGCVLMPLAMTSCGKSDTVTVTVSNQTETDFGDRTVELPAGEILSRLGTKGFYITNEAGEEIPAQLTHDSLIIFTANVPREERRKFEIHPSDSIHTYPITVWGDFYPRRHDDIAFENELIGFRVYGPGTQNRGEKAYGYDLFFKHPTDDIIVPELYAAATYDAIWAKVDSLRKIDPKLADRFIETFSYHIDHGKGMDCYAVGPTLGAGAPALIADGAISFPWCYETAEILDNGPLRYTMQLNFAPRMIGGSPDVKEHRIISLDSKSHLNNSKVWYDGLLESSVIAAGFPLRDESEVISNQAKGFIAYADPTQGPDNGKALIGVVLPEGTDTILSQENHVLLTKAFSPTDTLSYRWGFAWDRADISTLAAWQNYLENQSLGYSVTIE